MKTMLSFLAAFLMAANINAQSRVTVTVQNPTKNTRAGEMVELSLAQLKKKLGVGSDRLVVTDADGREVPSQQTYDGKLIFQIAVGEKGKSIYYVANGTPSKYEAKVFGRQFPERVDDMAWENDRVAFRCYGPALQRNGERAWGYDIWNKRTDRLVVEARYAGELDPEVGSVCNKLRKMGQSDLADDLYNAVSYHVDHGNGMDCYKVGPTLGAGTTALLDNGGKEIVYPRCYKTYEILDRGPLRFTVKLTYEPRKLGEQTYVETRLISLDAGSQMNKAQVVYEQLTAEADAATGIVVHKENPSAYVLNQKSGYMGYEDLGDPNQYKEKYRAKQNQDFGKIYVGVVFTQPVASMEFREGEGLPGATGHIVGISKLKPAQQLTYYFGTGWSRNPNTQFESLTDWEAYLSNFALCLNNPLKVTVK